MLVKLGPVINQFLSICYDQPPYLCGSEISLIRLTDAVYDLILEQK